VVEFDSSGFSADVMNETFHRSSLGNLTSGDLVDLERAMSSQGRFGGHIVSGHIDGTGKIRNIRKDGNAIWFEIEAEEKLLDFIVEKGSIAIDGISLTVAAVSNKSFQVSVIPHTLQETVLGVRKRGDIVNLENDVVGKYIKKFLEKPQQSKGLTREMLLANGF
jgi:riboflavin synthase